MCLFAQEKFVYNAEGKRNPFSPLVTADGRLIRLEEEVQNPTGLSLQGIIYDDKGLSYAIVNASVVKVGDTIGKYQVLRIEKNCVIFISGGETFTIELKKEGDGK